MLTSINVRLKRREDASNENEVNRLLKSRRNCNDVKLENECGTAPVSALVSRARKSKLVKVLNAGIVPVNTRRERCW